MPLTPENRSHFPAESEETQTILRIFEHIEARGYRNVFQDWLTMMLCTLNSPPREEDYLTAIQPYRNFIMSDNDLRENIFLIVIN